MIQNPTSLTLPTANNSLLDSLCYWCGCFIMRSINYFDYTVFDNGDILSKKKDKKMKYFKGQ